MNWQGCLERMNSFAQSSHLYFPLPRWQRSISRVYSLSTHQKPSTINPQQITQLSTLNLVVSCCIKDKLVVSRTSYVNTSRWAPACSGRTAVLTVPPGLLPSGGSVGRTGERTRSQVLNIVMAQWPMHSGLLVNDLSIPGWCSQDGAPDAWFSSSSQGVPGIDGNLEKSIWNIVLRNAWRAPS